MNTPLDSLAREQQEGGQSWERAPHAGLAADDIALLWQITRHVREAADEAALSFSIVNETLAVLPYRQAVLWRNRVLEPVTAVSGLAECDANAPYVQWLSKLCRELAPMPNVPVRAFTAADVSSDVAEAWPEWLPTHAAWAPLTDRHGRLLGGVLLAREPDWSSAELAVLDELAQVWSHALLAFVPQEPWLERARAWLRPKRRQRQVWIGIAVACLMPLRLTVLAPAEVTPLQPFMVRAPLDGVIERMAVQPNQAVVAGTPLFNLDATTLQSRYAVARKDYDTAQEEYRQTAQLAVTDDKGRLDMALSKGKMETSAVELDYTAQQLDRVSVRAARAGVAVYADPNDWVGKAVSVGEKVLLLADPAKVELTAYLPVADNIDVKPGMTLTLYPKSSPLRSYDARIDYVSYRAEATPDNVLAYRVKASFASSTALPTLGMMGTARIHGSWVPAVYYVLRRPLTLARQWLGW